MNQTYVPEVGQMLFGNPTGSHGVPDYARALFMWLIEEVGRVHWNRTQREWYDYEHETDVPGIIYRPYYWGDCDCGFSWRDESWFEERPHTDACFHMRYRAEEDRLGNTYQEPSRTRLIEWAKSNGFPDAPDGMAVYCDCGRTADYAKWRSSNDHARTCPTILPNFVCSGRDDVAIRFYKHLGRGLSVNRTMARDEWIDWFDHCLAVIQAADTV